MEARTIMTREIIRRAELIDILSSCRSYVTASSEEGWSHQSKDKIIDDLSDAILSPETSDLQELSLSNDWGEEFVALAARFDRALG